MKDNISTRVIVLSIKIKNYTSFHTNNIVSRELPSVILLFLQLSKHVSRNITYLYSRSGVNQMWILKNSKDMLKTLNSRSQYVWSGIKTFDLSTLYTTIPHKSNNWFSFVSPRRTDNKTNSILLLVETNLTLSKAIQNLIININVRFFYQQHICPVCWTGVSTNDWLSIWYELCSHVVSMRLWGKLPSRANQ